MSTTVLGQWPSWFSNAERTLADDATGIIEKGVYAIPGIGAFLALPIINIFSNLVISKVVHFLVEEFDRLMFAGWVAFRTKKEIGVYLEAKQSGNTETIDQAGDSLIHLGGN